MQSCVGKETGHGILGRYGASSTVREGGANRKARGGSAVTEYRASRRWSTLLGEPRELGNGEKASDLMCASCSQYPPSLAGDVKLAGWVGQNPEYLGLLSRLAGTALDQSGKQKSEKGYIGCYHVFAAKHVRSCAGRWDETRQVFFWEAGRWATGTVLNNTQHKSDLLALGSRSKERGE